MATLEIGTTFGGRYRANRLLGGGGTGVVVLAHDAETNDDVALKIIREELTTNPVDVSRFVREAKTAMLLESEHAVRVHAVDDADGVGPYVVMEALGGCVLSQVIASRGPLPVSEAVGSVLDALDALEAAHALELVHLDLKPSHLFRVDRPDGSSSIKVLGGWTAKSHFSSEGGTHTNQVWGSPLYMSPERVKAPRSVDARTDIWGIGVVLYELLAGVPPFSGETLSEVFVKILSKPPTSLRTHRSDVPEELDGVVTRCLQRDPSFRYEDASSLADALTGFAYA